MRLAARPPLARIMVIDQALRAGTWPNATTLGDQLEVDPRTIRRDIAYMRDQLRAPIEYDPRRNGYRYTDLTIRLAYFPVTEGELVALLLAERVLRQYRGTPFERDLRRAFGRLAEQLPDGVSVRLDALTDCLSVLPAARIDYDPEIFATLAGATVRRRRLEIVYWTAGRDVTTSRVVDPYHLMLVEDGWYLIAHCHRRGEVLVFAAQRVRSARETGETFDRPASFQVEDYMAGSFRTVRGEGQYRVVLRFGPEAAGRIAERIWHPSQTSERTNDGGLLLRFEVSDLREVKRWVMFWGADCEVLWPEELKAIVVRECQLDAGSKWSGAEAPLEARCVILRAIDATRSVRAGDASWNSAGPLVTRGGGRASQTHGFPPPLRSGPDLSPSASIRYDVSTGIGRRLGHRRRVPAAAIDARLRFLPAGSRTFSGPLAVSSSVERSKVGPVAEPIAYEFRSPYLALNQENHRAWERCRPVAARSGTDRRGQLAVAFQGHRAARRASAQAEVALEPDGWHELKPGMRLLGFRGTFTVNFALPDGWGIGKSSARGFGTAIRREA